ncbi:transporter, partial [Methylobacterium sp. E-025]|nr:transporter [Methylobacterium sp. E-025]
VFVGTNNPAGVANQDQSYFYNPFIGNLFASAPGNKRRTAHLVGAYSGAGDSGSLCNGTLATGCTPVLPQNAAPSIRNTGAISYTGDGYNLTAALTHSCYVDDAARFGGQFAALGPIV